MHAQINILAPTVNREELPQSEEHASPLLESVNHTITIKLEENAICNGVTKTYMYIYLNFDYSLFVPSICTMTKHGE